MILVFDSPLDPADGGAELHSELHEAVPAFSDDEDTEDFEPRIITDPNLKPKVDLQENKKKVIRNVFQFRSKLFSKNMAKTNNCKQNPASMKISHPKSYKVRYFNIFSGDYPVYYSN